jgi:pimeloyl-ACP methyl ester carboxylesterase
MPGQWAHDMAQRLPDAELAVFEHSGHMMFAEEQERYLDTVRHFLDRIVFPDGAGTGQSG